MIILLDFCLPTALQITSLIRYQLYFWWLWLSDWISFSPCASNFLRVCIQLSQPRSLFATMFSTLLQIWLLSTSFRIFSTSDNFEIDGMIFRKSNNAGDLWSSTLHHCKLWNIAEKNKKQLLNTRRDGSRANSFDQNYVGTKHAVCTILQNQWPKAMTKLFGNKLFEFHFLPK